MRYELTQDLLTGNNLIDTEHKQLFAAINDLLDACAQGKGREKLMATAKFLNNYVNKHFSDEEKLQVSSNYPGHPPHKTFNAGKTPAFRCHPAASGRRSHCARSGPAESDGRRFDLPHPHRRPETGQASERLIFPFYYKQEKTVPIQF